MRGGPAAINSLRLCCFSSHSSDLRVFPERYVVCVSRPEDASAHHGNLSLATVSAAYTPPFPLGEQSRIDLCVIIGTRCQIALSLYASWSVFRLREGGGGASEPSGSFGGLEADRWVVSAEARYRRVTSFLKRAPTHTLPPVRSSCELLSNLNMVLLLTSTQMGRQNMTLWVFSHKLNICLGRNAAVISAFSRVPLR